MLWRELGLEIKQRQQLPRIVDLLCAGHCAEFSPSLSFLIFREVLHGRWCYWPIVQMCNRELVQSSAIRKWPTLLSSPASVCSTVSGAGSEFCDLPRADSLSVLLILCSQGLEQSLACSKSLINICGANKWMKVYGPGSNFQKNHPSSPFPSQMTST